MSKSIRGSWVRGCGDSPEDILSTTSVLSSLIRRLQLRTSQTHCLTSIKQLPRIDESSSNFCGPSPCGYGSNCPHAHFFEASVGLLAGVRFTSSLHCHDQVTGPGSRSRRPCQQLRQGFLAWWSWSRVLSVECRDQFRD